MLPNVLYMYEDSNRTDCLWFQLILVCYNSYIMYIIQLNWLGWVDRSNTKMLLNTDEVLFALFRKRTQAAAAYTTLLNMAERVYRLETSGRWQHFLYSLLGKYLFYILLNEEAKWNKQQNWIDPIGTMATGTYSRVVMFFYSGDFVADLL